MFWSLDQLDFRNLTDMVNGPPPPGVVLVADRPKVIYNNLTKLYVMFMHLEYAVDHDPTPDNSATITSATITEDPDAPDNTPKPLSDQQ